MFIDKSQTQVHKSSVLYFYVNACIIFFMYQYTAHKYDELYNVQIVACT